MTVREVRSPFARDMLEPIDEMTVVQFDRPLRTEDYGGLAVVLEDRPAVTLRVHGPFDGPDGPADLGFLVHFPRLERLALDLSNLRDLDGLGTSHRPPR